MLERIDERLAKMLIGDHYEDGCDYYLETGGGGFRVIKSNRETMESEAYYVKDTPKDDGTRTPIWDVQPAPPPKRDTSFWKVVALIGVIAVVIVLQSIFK